MQAALPGAFLPPIKLLVLLPRLCLERQDTRLIVQSQTVKRKSSNSVTARLALRRKRCVWVKMRMVKRMLDAPWDPRGRDKAASDPNQKIEEKKATKRENSVIEKQWAMRRSA